MSVRMATRIISYLRQQPQPSAALYPNHRLNQTPSFLCRFVAACLLALFIIGAMYLLFHLVLRPRLPEFRVTAASVSPINATGAELGASWNISILANNPNRKLSVFYDRLGVAVMYGDDFLLSEVQLTPFFQAKKNQTLINARLAVGGANVGNDVVQGILRDKSRGVVRFKIRVLALARLRNKEWQTRTHLVKAYCNHIDIRLSSSTGMGTLLRPSKECEALLALIRDGGNLFSAPDLRRCSIDNQALVKIGVEG